VARWRVLLFVVLIVALTGISQFGVTRSPAQTAPSGTSIITSSGLPGVFNANYKVGRCRYTDLNGTWQTSAEIPAPNVTGLTGQPNQRIEWQPRLYQVLSTTPYRQLVASGALQTESVAANETTSFTATILPGLPQGPLYAAGGQISWFSNDVLIGSIEFIYTKHDTFRGSAVVGTDLAQCSPIASAEVSLSTYRTTVNVTVLLTGRYFPVSTPVSVTWNGKAIAQAMSDANGNVSASVRVPAAPQGSYRLGLNAGALWQPSGTLTVVPRIKVIPEVAARGQTVKVSLRGFAKREVVRIRWKNGGSWVELGRVTTSSTGSGELWVAVPGWAADGATSVRGDGTLARAQTNVVSVSGGPTVGLASEEPAPSPGTPEPIVDPGPATPAPVETAPPVEVGTPAPAETPAGENEPTPPDPESPSTPAP